MTQKIHLHPGGIDLLFQPTKALLQKNGSAAGRHPAG
jgi:hypothetical protein